MTIFSSTFSVTTCREFPEILDVMSINLFHTDFFAARRYPKVGDGGTQHTFRNKQIIDMKSFNLVRESSSLLKEKCHLKLFVERNLDTWKSHYVPDISVQGTLLKLEAVLDLQQYKLVRGFLAYNLGEPIDDVYITELYLPNSTLTLNTDVDLLDEVWKNLSIKLDLQNVSVGLQMTNEHGTVESSLACINFIKSSLIVECFSDGAQDVDLVSQEILVNDTRFLDGKKGDIKNVFPNILRPINVESEKDVVQAEVHSRRRKESSKYTILLNNMRLMAILDWLEVVKEFIFQMEEQPKMINGTMAMQVIIT